MPAREIILGVVGRGIEPGRFGATEAAFLALQDVASIGLEAKDVAPRAAAGRAYLCRGKATSGDGVCKELIPTSGCAAAGASQAARAPTMPWCRCDVPSSFESSTPPQKNVRHCKISNGKPARATDRPVANPNCAAIL
jgi:hypothetical protein